MKQKKEIEFIIEGNFQIIPSLPNPIVRTMYCKKCEQHHMPKIGNIVFLSGSTHKQGNIFSIKKEAEVNYYGFTPHLIQNPRVFLNANGTILVIFTKVCCMHGCGIFVDTQPFSGMYSATVVEARQDEMLLADFIALTNFKDHTYYVYG